MVISEEFVKMVVSVFVMFVVICSTGYYEREDGNEGYERYD